MTIATTMAQTNLLNVDRAQNEAMRVMLGDHKVHARPPTNARRQKVGQVEAYSSAVENPHNPLHEAVKDIKGCRLGRGKSWVGHA